MLLKHSVKFGNAQSAIAFAAIVVNGVFERHNIPCVITSANDSDHATNSLHYQDAAFDIRSKNVPTTALKQQILAEIKAALTVDFDVILEQAATDNEHYHLEYDPKG